jgi:hypothetical protein
LVKSTTLGDDNRGGAVVKQVNLLGQGWVGGLNIAEQVGYRPGNAVAFGLARNNYPVKLQQGLDQRGVFFSDRVASPVIYNLWAQYRVVFGEGIAAFELKAGLALAGDGVEKAGFFDRGHQGVANAPQHRVVGPNGEGILAPVI